MRRLTWTVLTLLLPLAAAAEENAVKVLRFDAPVSGPIHGLRFERTGDGKPGRWAIQADSTAPSGGHVLAQLDTDSTSYRFPIAIVDDAAPADVRVSVECKAVSGKVDQACGLVVRLQDRDNYYVARANALEDNVRLYYVKGGKRVQLASWSGKVTAAAWHRLELEARGDRLSVRWDGKAILDKKDTTFSSAGRVGVWTKADSVTYFDDLTVTAL
jgi:hypothetical protein